MQLIPPENLIVDEALLHEIDNDVKAMYRLIVFSEAYHEQSLLARYHEAVNHLREVLSIKNAQQEAHTVEEAQVYLMHLKACMELVIQEIADQHFLEGPLDLFRLFRKIAPEAAARHPNVYRKTSVKFGPFFAPEPGEIACLVEQLFYHVQQIAHPVLKAAYLHHELVRIHPFVDGNGRVSRMAKNWILMYELYPPVFIYGGLEHVRYISGLQESYLQLEREPGVFNDMTSKFFRDEIRRIKASTGFILNRMRNNPEQMFGNEDLDSTPYPQNQ